MESQVKRATGSPSPKLSPAVLVKNDAPVAPDDSTTATILALPTASTAGRLAVQKDRFPQNLPQKLGLVLAQNGIAYAVAGGMGNPYALPVGGKQLNNVIREIALSEDFKLRKAELSEINSSLQARAEMAGIARDVWNRVAPISGGIEIDLGDDKHTRVKVTAGKVEILSSGSESVFFRSNGSKPFVMPAETGNHRLLRKYVNADAVSITLLTAWLSYTLAHPKITTTNYVVLVLQGNQGSGKSSLCKNVIQPLVDPSMVGVQMLPTNSRDLAVIAQHAHLLCFDNVREFKQSISDMLCVASTGGALNARQLFSDADQSVLRLHVAMVLNGIHSFIDQPDLAQRCLPIQLLPLPENKRKSEADFVRDFQADAPAIFRGLLELIADVLMHLPTSKASSPERMLDFVLWLAAMETAANAPEGAFQSVYSDALRRGQGESLQENALASAIVAFAENVDDFWSGTPSELLDKLNKHTGRGTQRSQDWPQTPIALSKRLTPLVASLQTQGITVTFHRGKQRTIKIQTEENNNG